MIGEAVRSLVEHLDINMPEEELGDPFLSSHNYRAYPLDVGHFKSIEPVDSSRRLAFVDGGNQELVGAPNFSIQLNRVCFNIFSGRQRAQPQFVPERIEFLSLTFAKFRNEQIYYDTSLFPMSEEIAGFLPDPSDLSFNSTDRRMMVGTSRADIDRVASVARRFAEWEFARLVIEKELSSGDILVMDGTLRTAFTHESKYAKAAYATARARRVIYTGLSKTSRLFTTTGLSLLGAIRKLAAESGVGPVWYYYPIADSLSPEHEAAIFTLRLSAQSERVFRFEIHAGQVKELSTNDLNELFSQLSTNASDLTFPGYPYGLIDVDDKSRVRSEELGTYRVILFSEISRIGLSSKLQRHMQSVDAHETLNLLREVPYV
jgi:hypothetical protein